MALNQHELTFREWNAVIFRPLFADAFSQAAASGAVTTFAVMMLALAALYPFVVNEHMLLC